MATEDRPTSAQPSTLPSIEQLNNDADNFYFYDDPTDQIKDLTSRHLGWWWLLDASSVKFAPPLFTFLERLIVLGILQYVYAKTRSSIMLGIIAVAWLYLMACINYYFVYPLHRMIPPTSWIKNLEARLITPGKRAWGQFVLSMLITLSLYALVSYVVLQLSFAQSGGN